MTDLGVVEMHGGLGRRGGGDERLAETSVGQFVYRFY